MRLRKQSKPTAQPGDEFLRAVSSGQERRPPPAPAHRQADFSGLRDRLLESERRAAAADEALRQIRQEQDERLEQARAALARERQARIAAEQRLAGQAEAPVQQAPAEPVEPPAPAEHVEPAEPADIEPGLTFPPAAGQAHNEGGSDDAPEEGWPAPWLEEDGSSKRRLFRRSRS